MRGMILHNNEDFFKTTMGKGSDRSNSHGNIDGISTHR